jgi:HemY protein
MRGTIWLLLLFAAAVVAASTLGANDGLVSLYLPPWRMDVSLNLFLLVLLGTCFVLVSVIQAVGALTSLPQRAREWRVAQRERGAQAALREALAQYFGGRYGRAQKAAQRALAIQLDTPELRSDTEFTVLGRVLAAGSAHRLQDRAGRELQLRQALDLARGDASARVAEEGARLLAAEWAIDDRDAPRAMELLADLPSGVARRTHALRLKLQAARLARQPAEALKTARLLAKHQGFSKTAALGLVRSLAFEALETARDLDQVRAAWLAFDPAERRDAFIAERAAQRAAAFQGTDEARGWLRPLWEDIGELDADQRGALALAFTAVVGGVGADWLPRLEAAVRAHPRDAAIALAVGAALAERQIWGKARPLLEQAAAEPSLAAASRRHAWMHLAHLARTQGDEARAAQCFESASRLG